MHRRLRPALTLIELLLVIALLGLLALFVFPNLAGVRRGGQLDESTRRVRTALVMARADALNSAATVRLGVRRDGQLRFERQRDPLTAPHEFDPLPAEWARDQLLLDDVWVEAVAVLPAGPPPIEVVDDSLDFTTLDEDLLLTEVDQLEEDAYVTFAPDGTGDSAVLVLRHISGLGSEVTYDGRVGRISVLPAESIDDAAARRPAPLPEDAEVEE